jgi:hypothetical protein
MTAPLSRKLRQYLIIVLVGSMLAMVPAGCRFPFGESKSEQMPVIPLSELMSYSDAVNYYNAGEYEKAVREFESIRNITVSALMSRMALYGLACARLISAETPAAYLEAMSLWEGWVQSAPPYRQDTENPALLAPVIKDKTIFSYLNDARNRKMPVWLLEMANQEAHQLRKQLEEAGKGIDARDKKIKALEKEISRLNEQINAFETIDQKAQKRKHAIPSAD